MKKLTISDIKDILKKELEESKRHVQHYYLGTNRYSETDRLKSIYTTKNNSDNNWNRINRRTLKALNPKVNQALEKQGFDNRFIGV